LSSSSHLNFICFIDSLKHQFNTFKVHGQTQLLTYEGMITVHDLYGESRWLTVCVRELALWAVALGRAWILFESRKNSKPRCAKCSKKQHAAERQSPASTARRERRPYGRQSPQGALLGGWLRGIYASRKS